MADGFLGRWARRKLDVKLGRPVEEPAPPASVIPAQAGTPSEPARSDAADGAREEEAAHPGSHETGQTSGLDGKVQAPPPPPPTLEDVQALTPESDFSRFAAQDVTPEVRNAAMKKLFADPHFNVMDGLDIYIDDYSKPDPLPEGMLRSLASAEFLGFFQEEKSTQEGKGGVTADDPRSEIVSQSDAAASVAPEALSGLAPATPPVPPDPPEARATHADPDLRLQQDHAPGPEGPGFGSR